MTNVIIELNFKVQFYFKALVKIKDTIYIL